MEPNFKYDESMTFDENFAVWYDMNCRELTDWNETVYTREEGLNVFNQMFGLEHTN